ncbi:MAG TPA: KUP/HAK/KT family potassium transporter, partial [Bacteroidales bacterium]
MGHKPISTKHATFAGIVMTLGIVFGDIGTSPLYVMQSIIGGDSHVDESFILGALSCIIFTLTLQTTIKYVIITLRADNHGEGGIFSLFALIRRIFPWAFIFAIIGGTTLLADGIITPAITVVTAIEGLELYSPGIQVIPITIAIIVFLFLIQQFGTHKVGKSFGPIMFFWFLMLAVLGALQISSYPAIIKAFNPYYAIHFLSNYPNAYVLLGAIFLCTTGAEALYSDLGHCGAANIRISWVYVKSTLIINYLGQGAWVLNHQGFSGNPFFAIMPSWFLLIGVAMATLAAIIASQALISGSFTLISEAISLNFWPKLKKIYPSNVKGQVYIPAVNWFLLAGCILVILIFQKSSKMEAAYGLSITITMLMTTTLLLFYLYSKHIHFGLIVLVGLVYVFIESNFLIANLYKFIHGGWFTILLATLFFLVMYGWYSARKIRNRYLTFDKLDDYMPVIAEMSKDNKIPKYSTHLAFLTHANRKDEIEKKII